jgi:hypothetical protein
MHEHPGNRVVDGAAEAAALGGDVDERDRPLFKTSVLIHDTILARSRLDGRLLSALSVLLETESKLCFCLRMIYLPSPAEAGFAKAANRYPLFGIML